MANDQSSYGMPTSPASTEIVPGSDEEELMPDLISIEEW